MTLHKQSKTFLEGNQTAISHTEARDIVNKYFLRRTGGEDERSKHRSRQKVPGRENKKREELLRFPADFNTKIL